MSTAKEAFKAFLEKEKKFLVTVSLEKILATAGWMKLASQLRGGNKWVKKGEVVFVRKNGLGEWGFIREGNQEKVYPGWELFKANSATIDREADRKKAVDHTEENRPDVETAANLKGGPQNSQAQESNPEIKQAYVDAMSKFRNLAVVADREAGVKFYSQFKKEANFVFGKKTEAQVNKTIANQQEVVAPKIQEQASEQAPGLHKKIIDNVSLFKVAVTLGFAPKEYSSGSGVLSANDKKDIISQSDIVEVIERFVPERMKFREGFYYTPSPFSQSGEGELKVSRSKKYFFCEESKKTGNAATYLVEVRGMEEKSAYKWLADAFSVKLQAEKLRVYYEKGKSVLSIDKLDNGAFVFFDHNTEKGGTLFELITRELKCDRGGAIEWLYKNSERLVPEEKLTSFRSQLSEEMLKNKGQITQIKNEPKIIHQEVNEAAAEKVSQGMSI